MRAHLQPAVRPLSSDIQSHFSTLSRGRRTKIAKAANTTLVKAHQWAEGGDVPSAIAHALESAVQKLKK